MPPVKARKRQVGEAIARRWKRDVPRSLRDSSRLDLVADGDGVSGQYGPLGPLVTGNLGQRAAWAQPHSCADEAACQLAQRKPRVPGQSGPARRAVERERVNAPEPKRTHGASAAAVMLPCSPFKRDHNTISKPNHGVVSAHDNVSAKAGAATVLQRRASRLRRRAFSAANSVAAIDAARARRARASCKHLGLQHCACRVLHTHKVAQLAALAVLLRCTPLKKDTSTCFVVATSTLLCSLKSLRRSCAL